MVHPTWCAQSTSKCTAHTTSPDQDEALLHSSRTNPSCCFVCLPSTQNRVGQPGLIISTTKIQPSECLPLSLIGSLVLQFPYPNQIFLYMAAKGKHIKPDKLNQTPGTCTERTLQIHCCIYSIRKRLRSLNLLQRALIWQPKLAIWRSLLHMLFTS